MGLAPVVDLEAFRRRRHDARRKILQAANRQRVRRARYIGAQVWHAQTGAASLLSARHIQQAVAICRHWGLVGDDVLAAAGFNRPRRTTPPAAAARRAA